MWGFSIDRHPEKYYLPFTFKTSFVGNIEIGGGEIKFNLPLTNKRLVLNMTDLETFKEMLITKS